MAYDPVRQVVVLFGGTSSSDFNDTWEYSAGTWTRVMVTGPSARGFASMAYDAVRREMVLFGGLAGTSSLGDTWVYSGTAWTQRQPASSPTIRHGAGTVWDEGRQRVLVFGGSFGSPETISTDTWAWDGSTWTALSVGTVPRWVFQAAFDGARGVTLFYGGATASTSEAGLWELGSSWMQRTLPGQPLARHGASVAYDSSLQRTMVFGGYERSSAVLRADAFLFDGTSWQPVTPAPSARGWAPMVFDSGRNRLVLFGGQGTSSTELNDTWEY